MSATQIQIGDIVTGYYGDSRFIGQLTMFDGGYSVVRLTEPCEMGFRTEPIGGELGVDRRDPRTQMRVVTKSPANDCEYADGICYSRSLS